MTAPAKSWNRGGRLASCLALAIAWTVSGAAARAADPTPPAATPVPVDLLRAMSDALAKLKAFSYHAEIEFDRLLPGGPKVRMAGAVDVAVSRPASLYVDYRDDISDRVFWFDKGRATLLDPVAGTVAEVSGPKNIDGIVTKLEKDHGVTLPLGEFAESDPYKVLTRGVTRAFYIGVGNVEGIHCHHVLLERKDLFIQIWMEIGERPLPRKLVFEYPLLPGSPQFTASITEWSFEPPKPELFVAKIPEGAGKVEFLPLAGSR
jgi:hypothetical protein